VWVSAGSQVAAGSGNYEGRLTVRVERSGSSTAIADVLQVVEAAQARAAPVQRLADQVAGRFAYGVMAASASTLAFWSLAGPRLFPQVDPCP
jgi:P-type Cu+ transporter